MRRIRHILYAVLLLVVIACILPTISASAASAEDRLDGFNEQMYNFLKTEIIAVANGEKTSTEFQISDSNGILKWTKEDLGVSAIISGGSFTAEALNAVNEKFDQCFDFERINNALMAELPYELFWYDKTKGISMMTNRSGNSSEIKITSITFKFAVSADYGNGTYTTDPAKIAGVSAAVNNAKAIVEKYVDKSDWEKLIAYKDEICQRVSYNHTAADSSNVPYGNPWQMTSVFDDDASTNVVCEGYSKAFKYLCDITEFDSNVECYLVDGYMQGGTGEGAHMWNVVKINGGTLMVDVTNCDEGTAGAPDKLFLQVGQKNGDWYAFDCGTQTIYYTYSETEKDLHTDGYLELKPVTQQPPVEDVCDHNWSAEWKADDTEGHYHTCTLCGEKNGFAAHTYETVTTKATLTKDGSVVKKCSVCGKVASSTVIPRIDVFSHPDHFFIYDGTQKTPVPIVWDREGNALTEGQDYTLSYPANRTEIGEYTLKITFIGNYSGQKTLPFAINLATPNVSVSNATNGVKITWNAISGAKSYTVYKSVYSGGMWSGWTAIKTGLTGTTYTDASVKSNDNVKYTVRAVSGSNLSDFESSSSIKFLATPTVKASNAPTGVKITWNAISGAKNYKVYKSVYSGGKWSSWVAIKSVTGTTYTDTSVKSADNVKYTVRAFNGSYSSTYKASNSIKYLAAPTVKASNAANGMKLTWNKVSGAKTYTVYKSVYTNGVWSGWKAIKTGLTTTTYTDTSVKSNNNVRYTVRVFNGNFSSNFKASNSIKFLATPTVKVANAAKGVTVTWNKIAGAKTYTVYRSVYSGGKWSGWVAIKTGVTGTSYTDTAVKSGATVRYTVKVINGSFTSYIKASNTTKFLAQPAVKVAKATNGIKASWGKSAGATGYIVYRRTYSGGKWGGWAAIKTTTALSYTDTTAKKGVTYQYTVRAYSGSYKSSFTNSVSIKR